MLNLEHRTYLGGIIFSAQILPLITVPINVNLEFSFSFSGLDPNIYLGLKLKIHQYVDKFGLNFEN